MAAKAARTAKAVRAASAVPAGIFLQAAGASGRLISPEWEGLTERLPKTLMITVAADWMILLLSMNPIIIPALNKMVCR